MARPLKPSLRLENLYRDALSGRMRSSLEEFLSADFSGLVEEEKLLRDEFEKRFFKIAPGNSEETGSLAAALILKFQNYWNQVLLEYNESENAQSLLYEELKRLCENEGFLVGSYSSNNFAVLASYLKERLRDQGFYSLWGITQPHRELMVWKKQIEKTYTVSLPDVGGIEVPVVLLDDFLSLGWADYATLGRHSTGGWATSEGLYCVSSSYDLESEEFKVSYLAHEARHFSDYRRFPKLEQTDLEYRAKLTEISLADSSLASLLEKFRGSAKPDRSSPHAFASFSVIQNLGIGTETLSEPISSQTAKAFKEKAVDLIRAHDVELTAAGPQTVTGVL